MGKRDEEILGRELIRLRMVILSLRTGLTSQERALTDEIGRRLMWQAIAFVTAIYAVLSTCGGFYFMTH